MSGIVQRIDETQHQLCEITGDIQGFKSFSDKEEHTLLTQYGEHPVIVYTKKDGRHTSIDAIIVI